jgi:hypothetical protein
MLRSQIVLLLTVSVILYRSVPVTMAAEPSPEELIGLAPTVKSEDRRYSSIDISGYVDGGNSLQEVFWIQYRSPDRYSLYVADGSDNTPIIYFNNHRLFMYNAVDGAVLYLANASFTYKFLFEKGRFSHRIRVARSDDPCDILFDVKSLYDRQGAGDVVARARGGTFRLSRKLEGGKSFSALVDPSRRCPFKEIALLKADSNEPFLVVHELSVNEDVDGIWPAFPSKDLLVGKVDLRDWSSGTQFEDLAVAEFIAKCMLARPAIGKKEARESYEKRFGVKDDWDRVRERDRRVSRSVRELIKAPINIEKMRTLDTAR